MNPDPHLALSRRGWLTWGALILIVALAAVLRFTSLGWGLRHQPEPDERVFVEHSARMAFDGTLDHGYYYYPGFVFDVLAVLLGLRGTPRSPDPGAYLVARGLMAAMSTASVALVYLLGRSRVGVAAGLSAALFLAVSPVDVFVPHKVRPDAMLGTFSLLALLALGSLGKNRRADALAGAAVGAVAAVKFSAVLLLPSILLSWLVLPKRRWASLAVLFGVATLVFFLLTPYALLHARAFMGGALVQFHIHYRARVMSYSEMLLTYLAIVTKAFGPAALLALLALPGALKDWRRWVPLIVFPAAAILTFATSDVRHERFLAPAFGVVALLAGSLIQAVAQRRALGAAFLALAAAAFPFSRCLVQAGDLARPGTMDRVADWANASVAPGATLLTLVPELGLDTSRFKVVRSNASPRFLERWLALGPYLSREADYVVAKPGHPKHNAAVLGLEPVFQASPDSNLAGPPLEVFRVPEAERLHYDRLSLSRVTFSASENRAGAAYLGDERPDTIWMTEGEQRPGQWIEARWEAPIPLARAVLGLGPKAQRWGRRLEISVTLDGKTWKPIFTALGSGAIGDGSPGTRPTAQVLIIEPTCARGVRIRQQGRSERRWAVADLALDSLAQPAVLGSQARAFSGTTSCAPTP